MQKIINSIFYGFLAVFCFVLLSTEFLSLFSCLNFIGIFISWLLFSGIIIFVSVIPTRNLKVIKNKNNFENYLGMATEARYEYRGAEAFSNKRKKALPQSGCVFAMPAARRTGSVATPAAHSSGPSRQRRISQSLPALRLRFG
jgi:hypothetical protein